MAPTTDAPKLLKKRKLGKGKKKAWRASKVEDLEEFLDDERRQKQTGGLVSEKKDESLFFVDKSKLPKAKKSGGVSKATHKTRPLKCHALLRPDDSIESPIVSRTGNYKKGKNTQKILESIKARSASQVKLLSAQDSLKHTFAKKTARILRKQIPEVKEDLWGDDETNAVKVKRPKRLLTRPSKLAATAVAHPGASVNPAYEDHQELMKLAVDVEEKKTSKEKAAANAFKVKNRADMATPETDYLELTEGLVDDSEAESEGANQRDDDDEIMTSVRVPQKKSKRQRRAEAKLKEQMIEKRARADKNRRENMVFRINTIKTEMKKQEERSQSRAEAKLREKEMAPYKTKRLGVAKFEEPDVKVKLSEELVKSLRQVKPEGHVLDDLYSNMLRRNIIETRTNKKTKRKATRKSYIKRSFKQLT